MSLHRHKSLGLIDRSQTLRFRFDGRSYQGYSGDTVASALLGAGVRIFARSFKYHRPRGVWGSWSDDPNAIVDVRLNGAQFPNCQATTTPLVNGMDIRSVNAWPNARFDVKSVLDLGSRFMPAGFYYKTFIWPDWHLFEPMIRKMAGVGALSTDSALGDDALILHDTCDVLVIGAGIAGLAAAKSAAETGKSVLLVDDHAHPGGRTLSQSRQIEGQNAGDWIAAQVAAITAAGGRVLPCTTAVGVYDHQSVSLIENTGVEKAPVVRRTRADRVILAAGAIDRPVTFANNDRPGVMSLEGAADFLCRYGVLVGKNIAVLSNRPEAGQVAETMRHAGADVTEFEATKRDAMALGRNGVKALRVGGRNHACDAILTSAGLTPTIHLWRHAGGKLDWNEDRQAFVPGRGPDWMRVVGAANGCLDIDISLEEARTAALGAEAPDRGYYYLQPLWPNVAAKGRQWLDFQHDVTVKDVALAKRENMVSVEHLKRYTTLGMAGDQGKTSNMPALAAMAELQNKPIPEVGTTTFRPPFVPVPLEAWSGARKGRRIAPLKRLALEAAHRKLDAAMGEYGGWLRPAWYGGEDQESAVYRECLIARQHAAIMDGSALGKIEVMGPDAREFVNFVYYNTMSTLKPGRIRYGFMLTETGLVFDDGVMACVDDTRFLISCSSSHVDAVMAHLENWRQDSFDPSRIFIHDTTLNWSTVTVAGPEATRIVEALDVVGDCSEFPHMSLRQGQFDGAPARVARVSFTGDTSYEISVRSDKVNALWDEALKVGAKFGAGPVGTEALLVLRAEKGYVLVGKDTDGETMPHDLGFGVPRQKKKVAFIGDRSLHSDAACRKDRKQLVGLEVAQGAKMLPVGAHVVSEQDGQRISLGYVTSSHDSPTLKRPLALALLAGGLEKTGKEVNIWHMGETSTAKVVSACAFDIKGERLDA